jgi:DNA-binding MarR family transcriptional regulator
MTGRLQEELKQTRPFSGPELEALVSVMRTAALLDHAAGEVLKPHGITPTQYNVLRILRGAGDEGLCGRAVGERLVSQVPDVPRLLERMATMGLISRTRDPQDRRHVVARITTAGEKVLDDVTPCLERIAESRFARLGRPALKALVDSLDDVRAPVALSDEHAVSS